jgi:hypothetical protein
MEWKKPSLEETVEKEETPFDPAQPAGRGQNAQAAAERKVAYDRRKRYYVDDDGALQLDRFGQPLG